MNYDAYLSVGVKADTRTATASLVKFDRQLQAVDRSTTTATTRTSTLGRATTGLGATLASAAKYAAGAAAAYVGIGQVKDAVNNTTNLAKATISLNKNLGLSVKTASEWGAVAYSRGVDTRALSQSFGTLARQTEAAKHGTEAAVTAFKALGVTQKELKQTSPGKLIGEVSDGMKDLGSGTQRTAISMQLFGRGWQTIVPLLRDGSDAMQEQLDLANKYGATFSGKSVKSIEDLIQTERELKLAQLGLQVQFTKEIAPALIKVGLALASLINTVRKSKKDISEFVDSAVQSLKNFWEKAGILRDVLARIWGAIKAIFGNMVAGVKAVVKLISSILTGNFKQAWQAVKDIFKAGVQFALIPIKTMIGAVTDIAKRIAGALKGPLGAVWDWIKNAWRNGANAVIGFINLIIKAINAIPLVPNIGEIGLIGGGAPQGNTDLHGQHRFSGGAITKPTAIVGEEAPQHHEWVIATNPKYRMSNLKYWASAGRDLGVPGFAQGGLSPAQAAKLQPTNTAGAVAGAAGSVIQGVGHYLDMLPSADTLPPFFHKTGGYLLDKATEYIKDKVQSIADKLTGPMMGSAKGPKGVGTYQGHAMANWVIESLRYAASKGVSPPVTSGYRTYAEQAAIYAANPAAAPPGSSQHELSQYPGGAVDFGGFVDPVAYANKMAVVHATSKFKYPLLAPIGFSDDGHASGTGRYMGGRANYVRFFRGGGKNGTVRVEGDLHRLGKKIVQGRVSWFNGPQTADGHNANTDAGIAINNAPGTEAGWDNALARKWLAANQLFLVTINGHKAKLPVIDKGPAGWTGRAIDVTEPGVYKLGFTTGNFPTNAIGTAQRIAGKVISGSHGGSGGSGGHGGSGGGGGGGSSSPPPPVVGGAAGGTGFGAKGLDKLLKQIKRLRHKQPLLQARFDDQVTLDQFLSSPAGSDLSPGERANEITLATAVLTGLTTRAALLKEAIPKLFKSNPLKAKFKKELLGLVGITGHGGDILTAQGALDSLTGSSSVDNTDQIANLQAMLQLSNLRFGVSQSQYGVLSGAMAKGGVASRSGAYLVGERGPEVVGLSAGDRVTPNGGAPVIYINGDIVQAKGDTRPPVEVAGARAIVKQGSRGMGRRPLPGHRGH